MAQTTIDAPVALTEIDSVLGTRANGNGEISFSQFLGANNFLPGPAVGPAGPISFSMFRNETVIGTPPTVTLTDLTLNGATASWTAVPGADHYTIGIYSGTNDAMANPISVGNQYPTSNQSVVSPTEYTFSAIRGKYYAAILTTYYDISSLIFIKSAFPTGILFPLPPDPTAPTIEALTATTVTISWAEDATTSYKVQLFENDVSSSFSVADSNVHPISTPIPVSGGAVTVSGQFRMYAGRYYAATMIGSNINTVNTSGFSFPAMLPPPQTTSIVMSALTDSLILPSAVDSVVTWSNNPYATSYIVRVSDANDAIVGSKNADAGHINALVEFQPVPGTTYHANVVAQNLFASSTSSNSPTIYYPNIPPPPSNVTFSNFTAGGGTTSWVAGTPTDPLDAATYYTTQVYYATDSGMSTDLTAVTDEELARYITSPLTGYRRSFVAISGAAGLYYAVKIRSYNLVGSNYTFSPSQFFPSVPNPPSPVISNMTKNSFSIYWTPVTGETYKYALYASDVPGGFPVDTNIQTIIPFTPMGTTSPFNVSGTTELPDLDGFQYAVKMIATNINDSALSDYSPPSQPIPRIPTGVTTIPFVNSSSLDVTWNHDNFATSVTVEVYEANDAAITEISNTPKATYTTTSNVSSAEVSFSPTGGKYYTSRVSASNLGGASEFSAYTTPGVYFPNHPQPPDTSTIDSLTNGGAHVSWTASPSSPDPATTYLFTIYSARNVDMNNHLTSRTDQKPSSTTIYSGPMTNMPVFFTPVSETAGLYYAVAVFGSNFGGLSDPRFSTPIFYPAPPLPPVGNINSMTTSNITISWTPVEGESYTLIVSEANTSNAFATGGTYKDFGAVIINSSTSPYTVPGSFLGEDLYYCAKITASNSSGKTSISAFTNVSQPPPPAPTGVTMSPFNDSTLAVSSLVTWNTSSYATGYIVDVYGASTPTLDAPDLAFTTTITDGGIGAVTVDFNGIGGSYYGAKVSATNLGGSNTSEYSSNVGISNNVFIPFPPSAPSNVSIVDFFTLGQYIDVSWIPGEITNSNTALYYTVEILAKDSFNNSKTVVQTPDADNTIATPSTYRVNFAPNYGWVYTARISAWNNGGSNYTDVSRTYPFPPAAPVPTIIGMTGTNLGVTWTTTDTEPETFSVTVYEAAGSNDFFTNGKILPVVSTGNINPGTFITSSYASGFYYSIKVTASNLAGTTTSRYSAVSQPAPGAPATITMGPFLAGTLGSETVIQWSDILDGGYYSVGIYNSNTPTVRDVSYTVATTISALIATNTWISGNYYKAGVYAYNLGGSSLETFSEYYQFPVAPGDFTITVLSNTSSNQQLYWTTSTDALYYTARVYDTTTSSYVTQTPTGLTRITNFASYTSSSTPYTIFFIPISGHTYDTEVTAYNIATGTPSTNRPSFAYPSPPSAPTVTIVSMTTSNMDISWTPVDGVTYYASVWTAETATELQLGNSEQIVEQALVTPDTGRFSGAFPYNGYIYAAKLTASNALGSATSLYSEVSSPAPSPITSVTIDAFSGVYGAISTVVSWPPISSASSYTVNIWDSNDTVVYSNVTTKTNVSAMVLRFYNTTGYYPPPGDYRTNVVASTPGGNSASDKSTSVNLTSAPPAPTSVDLTNVFNRGPYATVSWVGDVSALYYTIEIDQGIFPVTAQTPSISTAVTTSPVNVFFTPVSGNIYTAYVSAVNLGGSTKSTGPSFTYPYAPAGLVATIPTMTTSNIDVSWSQVTNTGWEISYTDSSYSLSVYGATDQGAFTQGGTLITLISNYVLDVNSLRIPGSFIYDNFFYAITIQTSNIAGVSTTVYSLPNQPIPDTPLDVSMIGLTGDATSVTSEVIWAPQKYATSFLVKLYSDSAATPTNPVLVSNYTILCNVSAFLASWTPVNATYYRATATASSLGGSSSESAASTETIYFPAIPSPPVAISFDVFTSGNYATASWTNTATAPDSADYFTATITYTDPSGTIAPVPDQYPDSKSKITSPQEFVFLPTGGYQYYVNIYAWNIAGSNGGQSPTVTYPYNPTSMSVGIIDMTTTSISITYPWLSYETYDLTVYASIDPANFVTGDTNVDNVYNVSNVQYTGLVDTTASALFVNVPNFLGDPLFYSARMTARRTYGIEGSITSPYSSPYQPPPTAITGVQFLPFYNGSSGPIADISWNKILYETSISVSIYEDGSNDPIQPAYTAAGSGITNVFIPFPSDPIKYGKYFRAQVTASNLNSNASVSDLTSTVYFPNLPTAPTAVTFSHFFTDGQYVSLFWTPGTDGSLDDADYYTIDVTDQSGNKVFSYGNDENTLLSAIQLADYRNYSNDGSNYDVYFTPVGGYTYTANVHAHNIATDGTTIDIVGSSAPKYYSGTPNLPSPTITTLTQDRIVIAWTPYEGETYDVLIYSATDVTSFTAGTGTLQPMYGPYPADLTTYNYTSFTAYDFNTFVGFDSWPEGTSMTVTPTCSFNGMLSVTGGGNYGYATYQATGFALIDITLPCGSNCSIGIFAYTGYGPGAMASPDLGSVIGNFTYYGGSNTYTFTDTTAGQIVLPCKTGDKIFLKRTNTAGMETYFYDSDSGYTFYKGITEYPEFSTTGYDVGFVVLNDETTILNVPVVTPFNYQSNSGTAVTYSKTFPPNGGISFFGIDDTYYAVKVRANLFYGITGSVTSRYSPVKQPITVIKSVSTSSTFKVGSTSPVLDVSWSSLFDNTLTVNLYRALNATVTGSADVGSLLTTYVVNPSRTLNAAEVSLAGSNYGYVTAQFVFSNYGGITTSGYTTPAVYLPPPPLAPVGVQITKPTLSGFSVYWNYETDTRPRVFTVGESGSPETTHTWDTNTYPGSPWIIRLGQSIPQKLVIPLPTPENAFYAGRSWDLVFSQFSIFIMGNIGDTGFTTNIIRYQRNGQSEQVFPYTDGDTLYIQYYNANGNGALYLNTTKLIDLTFASAPYELSFTDNSEQDPFFPTVVISIETLTSVPPQYATTGNTLSYTAQLYSSNAGVVSPVYNTNKNLVSATLTNFNNYTSEANAYVMPAFAPVVGFYYFAKVYATGIAGNSADASSTSYLFPGRPAPSAPTLTISNAATAFTVDVGTLVTGNVYDVNLFEADNSNWYTSKAGTATSLGLFTITSNPIDISYTFTQPHLYYALQAVVTNIVGVTGTSPYSAVKQPHVGDPTTITVTYRSSNYIVTWTPDKWADSYLFTLFHNDNPVNSNTVEYTVGNTATFPYSGWVSTDTYYVQMYNSNLSGLSSNLNSTNYTYPAAPSHGVNSASASFASQTTVNFSWSEYSSDYADSYRLVVLQGSTLLGSTTLTAPATSGSVTGLSLASGLIYTARIISINAAGSYPKTAADLTFPYPPNGDTLYPVVTNAGYDVLGSYNHYDFDPEYAEITGTLTWNYDSNTTYSYIVSLYEGTNPSAIYDRNTPEPLDPSPANIFISGAPFLWLYKTTSNWRNFPAQFFVRIVASNVAGTAVSSNTPAIYPAPWGMSISNSYVYSTGDGSQTRNNYGLRFRYNDILNSDDILVDTSGSIVSLISQYLPFSDTQASNYLWYVEKLLVTNYEFITNYNGDPGNNASWSYTTKTLGFTYYDVSGVNDISLTVINPIDFANITPATDDSIAEIYTTVSVVNRTNSNLFSGLMIGGDSVWGPVIGTPNGPQYPEPTPNSVYDYTVVSSNTLSVPPVPVNDLEFVVDNISSNTIYYHWTTSSIFYYSFPIRVNITFYYWRADGNYNGYYPNNGGVTDPEHGAVLAYNVNYDPHPYQSPGGTYTEYWTLAITDPPISIPDSGSDPLNAGYYGRMTISHLIGSVNSTLDYADMYKGYTAKVPGPTSVRNFTIINDTTIDISGIYQTTSPTTIGPVISGLVTYFPLYTYTLLILRTANVTGDELLNATGAQIDTTWRSKLWASLDLGTFTSSTPNTIRISLSTSAMKFYTSSHVFATGYVYATFLYATNTSGNSFNVSRVEVTHLR